MTTNATIRRNIRAIQDATNGAYYDGTTQITGAGHDWANVGAQVALLATVDRITCQAGPGYRVAGIGLDTESRRLVVLAMTDPTKTDARAVIVGYGLTAWHVEHGTDAVTIGWGYGHYHYPTADPDGPNAGVDEYLDAIDCNVWIADWAHVAGVL